MANQSQVQGNRAIALVGGAEEMPMGGGSLKTKAESQTDRLHWTQRFISAMLMIAESWNSYSSKD